MPWVRRTTGTQRRCLMVGECVLLQDLSTFTIPWWRYPSRTTEADWAVVWKAELLSSIAVSVPRWNVWTTSGGWQQGVWWGHGTTHMFRVQRGSPASSWWGKTKASWCPWPPCALERKVPWVLNQKFQWFICMVLLCANIAWGQAWQLGQLTPPEAWD